MSLRNRPESFRDLIAYKAGGGKKDFGQAFMSGFEEGTLMLRVRGVEAPRVI